MFKEENIMENQVNTQERNQQEALAVANEFEAATAVAVKKEDVVLNVDAAMAHYSEEEKQEIIKLSKSIDVREIDNVMSYGAEVLKHTFDQCGDFLKDERGSAADQEVIAQVIELSKKAKNSYDDFNLVIKEPGLFQKIFLKLSSKARNTRGQKIQHSAATNYKLLMELKNSCESWLQMLKDAMEDISASEVSDSGTTMLLEKYIIAGKLAESRIQTELSEAQKQYQETGMQKYADGYEELKEGFEIFELTLSNLERSRIANQLSLGQLALIKRSNRNVQISIHTQKNNSMALMGQQLRNAVLNAKTKEVLEGQKAITKLNDELLKEVSRTVGLTADEAERLKYAGFYDVEAAKAAVQTVISTCSSIHKVAQEMLPKMKADTEQLNELLKELEPYVDSIKTLEDKKSQSPTGDTENKLKF